MFKTTTNTHFASLCIFGKIGIHTNRPVPKKPLSRGYGEVNSQDDL